MKTVTTADRPRPELETADAPETPIHTKSAGGIVLNEAGQVLVVSQHGTSWSLPKGRLEEGEDELTAARREIYEESGVAELTLVCALGSYERFRIGRDGGEDRTERKTIHMFLFETAQLSLSPIDDDNPEAKWVERGEVADLLTHPKDREFFASCAALLAETANG